LASNIYLFYGARTKVRNSYFGRNDTSGSLEHYSTCFYPVPWQIYGNIIPLEIYIYDDTYPLAV